MRQPHLLIRTDLLSRLGFLFVRTEVEEDDVDLLERPSSKDTAPYGDQGGAQTPGTVCLLQAVRLPVVVMENQGGETVEVEKGQVLGKLEEAELCSIQEGEAEDEALISAVTTEDFSVERQQRVRASLQVDSATLSGQEAQGIEELVVEYADVVALDSAELGSTDLVKHSIDTG